jgi:DNA recombination protein RmuC
MILVFGGLAAAFLASTILFFLLWQKAKTDAIQSKQSRAEMENGFQTLAVQVLNQQSEAFLKLATERLDRKTVEAKGVFDEKTVAIQKLVEPIEKTLSQVQNNLSEYERRRVEQYGQLSEQIKNVARSSETLQKETQVLSNALKRPEVRGSWGEMQLRRLMELSGMSKHCDFSEQVSVATDKGALRPDVVVHLPNKRILVVDSKVVLTSFLEYLEAATDEQRQRARLKHLTHVKAKIRELSQKSYWEQFEESPEFAILFIPNEAALHIAIEDDRELLETGWKERVIISSPTNLIALMKAVAYGWQQQEVAENAQKIFENTQELFDRLMVWLDHFKKSGARLGESVTSYNQSVASLESRVLPAIKRIQTFGATTKEIPDVNFIETQVRDLK